MSLAAEPQRAADAVHKHEPHLSQHSRLNGHAKHSNGVHHSNGTGAAAGADAALPHPSLLSSPPVSAHLLLPSDWPALTGPIDLLLHDLPHASSKTEWWYINSHVQSVDTAAAASAASSAPPASSSASSASSPSPPAVSLSFFVAFFRMAIGDNPDGSFRYSHSLTWALVDEARAGYHSSSTLDVSTPEALTPIVRDNVWQQDARLNAAMLEVLKKHTVPLPDRLFEAPCSVQETGEMRLQYGVNSLSKDERGVYRLRLQDEERGMAVDVQLTAAKAVQRQAHDGVVQVGVKDEWMFYYFIPRMAVSGSIRLADRQLQVSGDGWYDHEFGGDLQSARSTKQQQDAQANGASAAAAPAAELQRAVKSTSVASSMQDAKSKPDHAWNWLSLQLDNGCELTATYLVNTATGQVVDNYAIVILPDSSQRLHDGVTLAPLRSWFSLRTASEYPTAWSLTFPDAASSSSSSSSSSATHLTITSVFPEQEFLTLISRPAFYEGGVVVSGRLYGLPVSGRGFVERFGFNTMRSLDQFFRGVSKQVARAVDAYLPHHPPASRVQDLMCRVETGGSHADFSHLMLGLDHQVFYDTIVRPLRLIADRGGKSWRSYACLLCVDVVGGNSEGVRAWLPMPEIMHVGSLIIDDIQDESLTRRGGPACHVVFGQAVAINAANYAYFLSPRCLIDAVQPPLSWQQKGRLYEMYFHTMRVGHVGQATDLHGMDHLMDAVCRSGDADGLLRQRIACTHRMKSAVPAGCLARMGAFIGGGDETQIRLLGLYFEAVGLAFQIVDDVINLRGFVGDAKLRGEDITAGKVTFPVAVAMRADAPGGSEATRREIWQLIQKRSSDAADVERCISLIDACGGLSGSTAHADSLVEQAWAELEPHIPDSFYKLMLRVFGMYVLQRHY